MSFPKETIWQDLRTQCLSAIPPQSRVDVRRPKNLAVWQRLGYYRVSGMTSKRFDMLAPSVDAGAALLTDIEYLLDNAAEHQVLIWKQINSDEWVSQAWFAVTFYYWSYYLALALTRLTGKTAWHLTSEATASLRKLGPVAGKGPGAGCFRLTFGNPVSIADRTITLEKAKLRIHEEIWRLWLDDYDRRVKALTTKTANSLEQRLYTALQKSSHALGNTWPSLFRNAVNYRVGFAYTAVRRTAVLGTPRYLRQPTSYDFEDILIRFEHKLVAVMAGATIDLSPRTVLELLIEFTFLVHAIASEMHSELLDRHRLDARWRDRRANFLWRNGLHDGTGFWPI